MREFNLGAAVGWFFGSAFLLVVGSIVAYALARDGAGGTVEMGAAIFLKILALALAGAGAVSVIGFLPRAGSLQAAFLWLTPGALCVLAGATLGGLGHWGAPLGLSVLASAALVTAAWRAAPEHAEEKGAEPPPPPTV